MNTPSKQHSLIPMQSRQSMHSRPAHYEEAKSVEMNTLSKQHSLIPMQSRQSMHSRPAHYEEANFRHKAQSQDTTQSDMPNETTIPVVSLYIGLNMLINPSLVKILTMKMSLILHIMIKNLYNIIILIRGNWMFYLKITIIMMIMMNIMMIIMTLMKYLVVELILSKGITRVIM
jgi:hypothetical protein